MCRGPAVIDLPRHNANFCADHFLKLCRDQTVKAIEQFDMIRPGERVLVAVSGGKDSLAIWDILLDLGYDADGELPSYPLTSMRRHAVNVRTHGLLTTADEWQDPPADAFTAGAPEPRPRMRLVPSEQAGQEAPLT